MSQSTTSYFQDLLTSITERGRRMLDFSGDLPPREQDLPDLCTALLSGRGEASGVALAGRVLDGYDALSQDGRLRFFTMLVERFGVDAEAAVQAAEAYRRTPDTPTLRRLIRASEPPRQELLRRLNLAPGATRALVGMRADLLGLLKATPALDALDLDFTHLFQSWFNRGFLIMRRIDWQTPAAILEKIIRYEAVHEIGGWDDLRGRIDPPDRRLYAFFHPALADDPLIFVEVALTGDIPGAIGEVLSETREQLRPDKATTAVFYSISNCQPGLRGVSFGNFLIKQVVEDLAPEIPSLKTFVTLSPVPGLRRWVEDAAKGDTTVAATAQEVLQAVAEPGWAEDEGRAAAARAVLMPLAAHYFLKVKDRGERPLDPVARFHLGNGARLERINWLGNPNARGLNESLGVMVNYLYALKDIEANHEAFARDGTIAATAAVRKLAGQVKVPA